MKTLLAFEFKKLICRKIVWVALALSAALLALNSYYTFRFVINGTITSMREVYARYEGQTLTDALRKQILTDYQDYAIAHPDDFTAHKVEPGTLDIGYWAQTEHWHAYGVMVGTNSLFIMQTAEEYQQARQEAKDELKTGMNAAGDMLSVSERKYDEDIASLPPTVPIIHYDLGWTGNSFSFGEGYLTGLMKSATGVGLSEMVLFGIIVPICVLLMGLAGWAGERRMEAFTLTGVRRKHALLAKVLAAMFAAAAVAAALCLWEIFLRLAQLGVQGWNVVPTWGTHTHLHDWAVSALLTVLGCAACAALITLMSAAVRASSLAGLGLSVVVLAAQFFLWKLCEALYFKWMFAHIDNLEVLTTKPLWAYWIDAIQKVLPLYRINAHGAGNLDALTPKGGILALALAVAVGLCALCLWLAPRLYLRRRKV